MIQKLLEPIINEMSKELGVPYEVCWQAYMSQWHYIHDKLKTLNLKGMTMEEFQRTKHNFNLPSIGKLYVTDKMFEKIQERYKIINAKKQHNVQDKEDLPNVQQGNHDDE